MYNCKYCNKEFEKPYQLAAHVSMCKLNPNYQENLEKRKIKKTKEQLQEERIQRNPYKFLKKERILKCKKCGKEYTLLLTDSQFDKGKYKKYCSRSCANSKQHSEETKRKISQNVKAANILYIVTEETKEKISKNMLGNQNAKKLIKKEKIKKNNKIKKNIYLNINDIPKDICKYCNKEFIPKYIYNENYYKIIRHTKFCSPECLHQFKVNNFRQINKKYHLGGFKEGSVKNYKSGWYHGIHCDSSWELAFIIYHEEHGNKIKRYKEIRHYILNGKEYNYHPDFIVNDKDIYEIKGIKSKMSDAKQLYNKDIIFLYRKDMKIYLDYVIEKYGKNFIDLYDKKDKNV